jgi:sulfur carrier protein
MEIKLNDKTKEVELETSVQQLLNESCGEKQKGIAIAINNTVIPKTEWSNRLLKEKDHVLIIKATQGG